MPNHIQEPKHRDLEIGYWKYSKGKGSREMIFFVEKKKGEEHFVL